MVNILLMFAPDAVSEASSGFALIPTVVGTSADNCCTVFDAMRHPQKFLVFASLGIFDPEENYIMEVPTSNPISVSSSKGEALGTCRPKILCPAFNVIKFLSKKPEKVNLILDTSSVWALGYTREEVIKKWNMFAGDLATALNCSIKMIDGVAQLNVPGTNFNHISWPEKDVPIYNCDIEEMSLEGLGEDVIPLYDRGASYINLVYGKNITESEELKEMAYSYTSQIAIFTHQDYVRYNSGGICGVDAMPYKYGDDISLVYFNSYFYNMSSENKFTPYHIYNRYFLDNANFLDSGFKVYKEFSFKSNATHTVTAFSSERSNRLIDYGIFEYDTSADSTIPYTEYYTSLGDKIMQGIELDDQRQISKVLELELSNDSHSYMHVYNKVYQQLEDEADIPAYEKPFGIPLVSPLFLFESRNFVQNAQDLEKINAKIEAANELDDDSANTGLDVEDEDLEEATEEVGMETSYFNGDSETIASGFIFSDETIKYTDLSRYRYMGASELLGERANEDANYSPIYQGDYTVDDSKSKIVQPLYVASEFAVSASQATVDPSIITEFYRFADIVKAPKSAFKKKTKGTDKGSYYVREDMIGNADNNRLEFNAFEKAFYGAVTEFLADCTVLENFCLSDDKLANCLKTSNSVVGNKYLSNMAGKIFSAHWIHTNYDSYMKVVQDESGLYNKAYSSKTVYFRLEEEHDSYGNAFCQAVSDTAGYTDRESLERSRIARSKSDICAGPEYISDYVNQTCSAFNIWGSVIIQLSRWGTRKQNHLNLDLGYKKSQSRKASYFNLNTCKSALFDGSFENLEYRVLGTRNGVDKYEEVIGLLCISLLSNDNDKLNNREKAIINAYPDLLDFSIHKAQYLPIAVQVQKISDSKQISGLLDENDSNSISLYRDIEIFEFIDMIKSTDSPFSNVYFDKETEKIIVETPESGNYPKLEIIPFNEEEYSYFASGTVTKNELNNYMRTYINSLGARRNELDVFTLFNNFQYNPSSPDTPVSVEEGFDEETFKKKLADGFQIAVDPNTDLQKTVLRGPLAEVYYKLFYNYLTLGINLHPYLVSANETGASPNLTDFMNSIEFNEDFETEYASVAGFEKTAQTVKIISHLTQKLDATGTTVLSTSICPVFKMIEANGSYYGMRIPMKNNLGYLLLFSEEDMEVYTRDYGFKPCVTATTDFTNKADDEALQRKSVSIATSLVKHAQDGSLFKQGAMNLTVLFATNKTKTFIMNVIK